MVKLEPTLDNVVLIRDEKAEVSKGGIILPDSVKHKGKAMRGKVVAVGPGRLNAAGKFDEVGVKKGDTVCFGAFSGHDVELEGKIYTVLPYTEVLMVVRE